MKKLLTQRIKKTEEIPKYLSIKQAKLYLEKKEFLVNESKLYKMTSESKILFYQLGNRNYFFPDEQDLAKTITKISTTKIPTPIAIIVFLFLICCSLINSALRLLFSTIFFTSSFLAASLFVPGILSPLYL